MGDPQLSAGQWIQRTVEIVNVAGLHVRPAAELVKLAGRYSADIMGVLMLAAERGTQLRISANGADAEEAVRALSDLVSRGFGELEA